MTKRFFDTVLSPIGRLVLESDGKNLTHIYFEGQMQDKFIISALPIFVKSKKWLEKYFEGKKVEGKALPLAPQGSAFAQKVWARLLDIQYGQVTTYGQIAKEINAQSGFSARAVGRAVGSNPIPIIIPCHRVIGKNGSLTGYSGGLDKKVFLLSLEGYKK